MSNAPSSAIAMPGRLASSRAALDRVLRFVALVGPLLLVAAFALGALSIWRDYHLRVNGLWNSVTGTPLGVAAHTLNKELAGLAAGAVPWLTAVVALALAIPRRRESALFRWAGWIWIVVAVLSALILVVLTLGATIGMAFISFDPSCPLDGPCDAPPRAMLPGEWCFVHVSIAAIGAMGVLFVLSAAAGFRWLLWSVVSLVRRATSRRSSSR